MSSHTPRPIASTFQHIRPMSQLSMPDTPEPSTMHSSPACCGFGSSGEQRVEFHAGPPSFAHGMHFSSLGQSCANRSHSNTPGPPSGLQMKLPHGLSPPSVAESSAPPVDSSPLPAVDPPSSSTPS